MKRCQLNALFNYFLFFFFTIFSSMQFNSNVSRALADDKQMRVHLLNSQYHILIIKG